MTTELAERRKGQALALFVAAAGLIGIAAVTVGIETRASRPDLASGPVVPGLHDTIGTGRRIIITSSDASYRIERAQRGNESIWVMRDRGDYPVLGGRLAQLTQGLEQLHFTRRMTTDPAKFDRLGVGDPRHGGRGVLVQIEDGRGALLVNLILGTVPTAGQNIVYVRRPGENQAWAAEGPLPPLRDVASWLNLRPLDLPVERLMHVEISPAQGRPYILDRGADASWNPAQSPADLTKAVHDNLRNLGVEVLDVVNLRIVGATHAPTEGSIEERFTALADLQRRGLIRHLGLSNVTSAQVAEAGRIAKVVCVQNQYNLAHRDDDALIDELGRKGVAYVPFFPLGGFSPLQSQALFDVAQSLDATPMQVALAWLLRRAPNILLIPGTSTRNHLRENLVAAALVLPQQAIERLDGIGSTNIR